MASTNPYAAPKAAVADTLEAGEPIFFPVSKLKLAVMSVATFGLYEIYWFYKNWQCVQRQGESVLPAVRALFYPFTAHSLFKHVVRQAGKAGVEADLQAVGLALAVLVLALLWRLPDPWWLVSYLSFAPLLPVQDLVNQVNARTAPGTDRNARFSAANIAGIVIGGILLALAVIGVFLPES